MAGYQGVIWHTDGSFDVVNDNERAAFSSDEKGTVASDAVFRERVASKSRKAVDIPLFIHKNRDGSLCVRSGEHNGVWPEDEK